MRRFNPLHIRATAPYRPGRASHLNARAAAQLRSRIRLQTGLLLAAMFGLAALLTQLLFGGWSWALGLGLFFVAILLAAPQLPPAQIMRWVRAQPMPSSVAPEIRLLVGELSARAGLEHAPELYLLRSAVPNAFSVGGPNDAAYASR